MSPVPPVPELDISHKHCLIMAQPSHILSNTHVGVIGYTHY